MAKAPFINKFRTSILGSTLILSIATSSKANPPKTTFLFYFSAASRANFISRPGVNGLKSFGKALKASTAHNHK